MIQFKTNDKNIDTFSFDVVGGQMVYVETIKALLFFMGHCQSGYDMTSEAYYMCNLIEGMLPDERQIISIEDADLFEKLKEQKLKK